jgi:hypothetical protein
MRIALPLRRLLAIAETEPEARPTWPVPPAPVLPAHMKTHVRQFLAISFRCACLSIFLAIITHADEVATHHFDAHGAHQTEGFPEQTPSILAIAGKSITLHFSSLPAEWNPVVHIHRITSSRQLELDPSEAKRIDDIWQLTWTPPETRGPAQYLIRLKGEPNRVIRIETRDRKWLDATLKALAGADWEAQGLTAEERAALATRGIQIQSNKAVIATLEIRPRQGDAARRRIVWDEENPTLLVLRPGPAVGDLEARAPRWWISPAALATDHGLIRFLDLFSKPPLNP